MNKFLFAAAALVLAAVPRASAQLSAAPTSLAFPNPNAIANPYAAQFVTVFSANPSSVAITVASSSSWLTATALLPSTASTVQIAVNTQGLAAGTYQGTVTVSSAGILAPLDIPVTLTVQSGTLPSQLTAMPATLGFTYQIGSSVPPAQPVTFQNAEAFTYTAAAVPQSGGSWLTVSPSSGGPTTSVSVSASVHPEGLVGGTYQSYIVFTTAAQNTVTVPVTLTVTSVASGSLNASPSSLSFSYQLGTAAPPGQILVVTSPVSTTYTATAFSSPDYLTLLPATGGPSNLFLPTISVNTAAITAAGVYAGVVQINTPGQTAPLFVPVTLTVTSGPLLDVNPKELSFVYTRGGPLPLNQNAVLTSSQSAAYVAFSDSSAVSVGPGSGSVAPASPALLTIGVTPGNLPQSATTSTVFINPTGGANGVQLKVNLFVADGPANLITAASPANAGQVLVSPPQPTNGTTVQLTAASLPGYRFFRWTGAVTGTTNPTQLVVLGTAAVTAEFITAGPCTYTFSPTRLLAPATGDVGRLDIITDEGCAWNLTGLPAWFTNLSPVSGGGPGSISYLISPNFTAVNRAANLGIAGTIVPVEQSTQDCATLITPSTGALPATGALPFFNITAPPTCSYTPISLQDWFTPASSSFYIGSAQVPVAAVANPLTVPRASAVYFAGFRIPVIQQTSNTSTPFIDVPASNPFSSFVTLLRTNNITAGCDTNRFCPGDPTTRSQMAIFLVRALLNTDTFPYNQVPVFQDVPANHPHFKWVQKLVEFGITSGCSAGSYCPGDPVTRGQMAAFLVRARARITAAQAFPSVLTPFFNDVNLQNPFFPAIQKMREWGIAAGCDLSNYCPDAVTTREQMAAFLIRAFFPK